MSATDSSPPVHAQALEGAAEGAATGEQPGEAHSANETATSSEVEDLAWVIHDAGCSCRGHKLGWTVRISDAQLLADAILAAGFRRVPEDSETVERVAQALHDTECGCAVRHGEWDWRDRPDSYVEMAGAALAALRGGERQ